MATFDKNLTKLTKLLSLMDEQTLTKEDFLSSFKQVVEFVKKSDEKHSEAIKSAIVALERKLDEIEADTKATTKATLDDTVKGIETKFASALKEQENSLNFMRDYVRGLEDGKDADEEEMVERLASMIPDVSELQVPQEIYDMLESLKTEHERLAKELENVSARKVGGGGGTSSIGVASAMKHIVKHETPTGDIDGANTTYTVTKPINAVLSFGINGMVIHPSEYTYSGRTITMTTALDASLSGTTFQITYL